MIGVELSKLQQYSKNQNNNNQKKIKKLLFLSKQ